MGAAGVGGEGGDACGVGVLDGVAEGFEFAGVDEDVEGGEGVGELGTGLGAEEAGGGEEFAEAWFEGPGADDGEGGVGEVGDGLEPVEAFFGGEATNVSDDAVSGVGLKRVVSTPLPQCLMVVMPWLRSSVMVLVEGARVRSQWLWMWVIQRQAAVLSLGRW